MKKVVKSSMLMAGLLSVGMFASSGASAAVASCDGVLGNGNTCNESNFYAGVNEYSFTTGSGVTGLNLSGNQNTGADSFYVLSSGQAEIFDQSSALDGFFNVSQNTDYTLYVMGPGGGSYNLALTAVPIPAAAWLFGSVLVALGITGRKRNLGQKA